MFEKELSAYYALGKVWMQIYDVREALGKDHPEYEAVTELMGVANDTKCEFHKYLPERRHPAADPEEPKESRRI